jgi:hypothetical protein
MKNLIFTALLSAFVYSASISSAAISAPKQENVEVKKTVRVIDNLHVSAKYAAFVVLSVCGEGALAFIFSSSLLEITFRSFVLWPPLGMVLTSDTFHEMSNAFGPTISYAYDHSVGKAVDAVVKRGLNAILNVGDLFTREKKGERE